MKKIKYNNKIEFLEKEYGKARQDLKDLQEFYSYYLGNEGNLSSVLKRTVDGTLSNNDKQFLSDLLKCHRYLHEIEERINQVRSIQKYKDQIRLCYFSYITQQELRMMMDDGDESAKCYERFIPDEVETGYFATEEDRIIAEQTHACYKNFTTQQEEDEASDIINKNVEKYATYIPEDVELNVDMDLYEDVELETKGIKMVELNHGLVSDSGKHEIAGKVSNSQLTSVQTNLQDRMDQNVRRRANGAEGFNGRYGQ